MRDPDLRALRDRLARRFGRDVALLGAIPIAFAWWEVIHRAPQLWLAALAMSACLLASAAASLATMPPGVRVGLVLSVTACISMTLSVAAGLMPATGGGAAILCLLAAFLAGPRLARTLTGACVLWFLAVGAFHRIVPGVVRQGEIAADVTRPENWLRAFFTFLALTVVAMPALIEHVRALSRCTRTRRRLLAAALDEERKREEAAAARAHAEAARREVATLEVIEFMGEGFARTCGNLLQAIRTEVELIALPTSGSNGENTASSKGSNGDGALSARESTGTEFPSSSESTGNGMAAHSPSNASLVREGVSEMVEAVKGAAAVLRRLDRHGEQYGGEAVGPVDLAEVAESMKRQLGKLDGIEIVTRTKDGVVAQADGPALEGVILNLALNARDAMPSGGTLTLAVRPASATEQRETHCVAALDVRDTGSGMSETTLSHAFEPFFTTKGATGTGLGLNAARRVLEAMGGHIRVQSALGKGTTFTLLFPAAGETARRPVTPTPPPRLTKGVPVLIADDHPAVRRGWRAVLSSHEFSVLEAASVDEALELARAHPVALAWIDAAMPGRPARDLVDELRRTWPAVHLVVCSGLTEEELRRRDLRSGDLELIAKPCPIEVFLERVALAAADYRAGFAVEDV